MPYYATYDADDIINEDIYKRSISEKIHADTSSVPVYKKTILHLAALLQILSVKTTRPFVSFFYENLFA